MMPLFVNPVGFNFTTIDARSSPIFQISGHYEAQRHVEVCVCVCGGGELIEGGDLFLFFT